MPLLALALLVPPIVVLVEVLIVVGVAHLIGLLPALLILLATSLAGMVALRAAGPRTWRRFRTSLADGRATGGQATDGLLTMTGAGLLAIPGYLTDVVGLALLIPPVRGGLARLAEAAVTRRLAPAAAGAMFGPRTVRAHQTRADSAEATDSPLEGEIVDEPGARR